MELVNRIKLLQEEKNLLEELGSQQMKISSSEEDDDIELNFEEKRR